MTNDQRMVDVELLRPFAALLQTHNDQGDDSRPVFAINDALITIGDLRKLRDIIATPGVEPVASNTKAAGEAIELVFDERNWPANPVAAARCGWEACLRTNYLAAPSAPVPEWPVLDKPALVGGGRFHVGVSSRLVVEAAQRHYEYEVAPEKEAERIAKAAKAIDALVAPVQATECDECHGDPSLCDIHDCGDAHKTTAKTQAPVQAVPDWQPIETAPTSPDWVIGLLPDGDVRRCVGDHRYWFDWHGFVVDKPTHWMPLPKPPKEIGE